MGEKIAAIIPCYNEEATVATVVADLRAALPDAEIYVYDNNSTDRTSEVAAAAGAHVRHESRKGKGNVVRRAFADIDADIYLMIDGDDTYDASAAPSMIEALREGPLDHVLGTRRESAGETAYRPGHEAGNKAFNRLVSGLFGENVTDMLSGYRVFSRRFVKSFPAQSRQFEIETELTVHTINLRVPQTEVPVGFKDRPEGSESKLNTFRDGFRILGLIGRLVQHERPVLFYGVIASLFALLGLVFGIPVIIDFWQTGLVERFPTAFLASSLMILAMVFLVIGLVLNGVLRGRQEAMRLQYLRYDAPRFVGATTLGDR